MQEGCLRSNGNCITPNILIVQLPMGRCLTSQPIDLLLHPGLSKTHHLARQRVTFIVATGRA